jgi:hypothetical protein
MDCVAVNGGSLARRWSALPATCYSNGIAVRDTVQAKLVELGVLQPAADGAGWELTQQVRELLSATLTHPHNSKLAGDLLDLGMIEPAPAGSGLWWTFTPQGRKLLAHLLNNPVAIEMPDSDAGG